MSQQIRDAATEPFRLPSPQETVLLDSSPEEAFDRLTRLAARVLTAPVAWVSFAAGQRQVLKSAVGLPEPWATLREIPRAHSVCAQVMACGAGVAVGDLRTEPGTAEWSVLHELGIIAYLGVPLVTPDGETLGTFCVMDRQPRDWSPGDLEVLTELSAAVMTEIGLRREMSERRAVEERLKLVTSRARCILWSAEVVEQDGRLRWKTDLINPEAAQEVLGITRPGPPPTAMWIQRAVPEDVPAIHRNSHSAILAGEEHYSQEYRFYRDSGEVCWLYEDARIQQMGSGRWQVVGVSVDVTERHQAEQRLRHLVESVKAIPWEADPRTGRYTYVGPQAEAILGYSPDEWRQPEFHVSHLHPEDRERLATGLRRAAEMGGEREYRMLAADGRTVWLRETVSVVPGKEGPAALCGFLFDVTEQKQTEMALRESHAILRAVSEGTTDAVFVKDLEGRYLMINTAGAGFLGKRVEEVVGRHDSELFSPDTVHAVLENDRLVMTTGQTYTREERLTAAGATRIYLTTKGPFRDDQGQVIGMIGISREITDRKAAEEALKASEALFRAICEAAPIGIFVTDLQGETSYANQEGLRHLGLSAEEARGTGWARVLHPEDRERVIRDWTAAAAQRRPFNSTHRFLHPDGAVVWCDVRAVPSQDEERAFGYVVTSADITQRTQEAETLQQQKELLQAILEHIPAMIAVIDETGNIVFVNQEWERILGWSLDEISRRDILAELYPDPAYRQGFLAFIQEATSTWDDFKTRVRDGRVLDTSWANVRLSNGWCIGIGQDVTQRKLAEQRNQVFQSLGQLLNQATTPSEAAQVVLDVADQLFGWDACWLELQSTGDLSSQTSIHIDLIDGRRTHVDSPHYLNSSPVVAQVLKEGPVIILRDPTPRTGENPLRLTRFGDTTRNSASILCVPIRNGERVIGALSIQSYTHYAYSEEDLGVLASLADYCAGALERTQAEAARETLQQQLVQAQKMEAVGRLAGGIAHDFNNMLAVINGYSDLLATSCTDGALRQGLKEIHRAGARAAELTRQLLAFSRRQLLEPKILDLNQVVRDTERMLQRMIGEDVELTTELAPALGKVKADPSQLSQVLMNLAVNARDAMPQGGQLSIRTENVELDGSLARRHPEVPPGRYVLLSMADTGCGMTPEILARIWEPFFTTKGVGEGTGLGLAMIYGIVKQSDGHVEVESTPGKGACFSIYLPRLEAAAAPDAEKTADPLPPGSETVLVVEDDDMVRNLVRTILRMQGYTVLEARNGEQGLEAAQKLVGPIHLLLTDVVMPGGMSGRVLAEKVAAFRPETKVLYMSGYTDDAMVRHGIRHAQIEFIQKPFDPVDLGRKVRELLHPGSG